jgi:hypothetical protein
MVTCILFSTWLIFAHAFDIRGLSIRDYDYICNNGHIYPGSIDRIQVMTNINLQGINPILINYSYETKNILKKSQMFVMPDDTTGNHGFFVGDSVNVSEYGIQSVIVNVKPMPSVTDFLLILSLLLFLVFLISLLFLLYKMKRYIYLVKHGNVVQALVDSIYIQPGYPYPSINTSAIVYYSYISSTGRNISSMGNLNEIKSVGKIKSGKHLLIFVSKIDESHSMIVPLNDKYLKFWGLESGLSSI